MNIQRLEFSRASSMGLILVGNLYTPDDFDATKQYKTIIVTPPAHQIKEQTKAEYAPKFVDQDYLLFAFDYNSKGESQSYKEGIRNDGKQLPQARRLTQYDIFLMRPRLCGVVVNQAL
jgi:hypothetical protein